MRCFGGKTEDYPEWCSQCRWQLVHSVSSRWKAHSLTDNPFVMYRLDVLSSCPLLTQLSFLFLNSVEESLLIGFHAKWEVKPPDCDDDCPFNWTRGLFPLSLDLKPSFSADIRAEQTEQTVWLNLANGRRFVVRRVKRQHHHQCTDSLWIVNLYGLQWSSAVLATSPFPMLSSIWGTRVAVTRAALNSVRAQFWAKGGRC